MTETILFGKLVGIKNFGNQFVLLHSKIDGSKIKKINTLFIQINKQLIPFFITSIVNKTETETLVTLEDVNTYAQAQVLLKKEIWIYEKEFKKILYKDEMSIIGYTIIDQNNIALNKIIQVQEVANQTLATLNYNNKEVMIPIHKDNIIGMNKKSKTLQINILEGLLDV